MAIIAVLATLGILGMSIFRQTVAIEQSFSGVVSNLKSAQNKARNNISSQVLEEITGSKLDAVVGGYAIAFDETGSNYSLRYCLKEERFTGEFYDCTGIEQEGLKSAQFDDVLVYPQDSANCSTILFRRGTGNISSLVGDSAVPNDDGECILVVRHNSGSGERLITIDLNENNIDI